MGRPELVIKSVKPLIPKTHISPTENFDFGKALARVYPLLDLIFEYLPADDLKACSEVSQSWGATAKYVLEKRRAPSWFTCYNRVRNNDEISSSPNFHYNNAGIGIIFYNSRLLKLNGYVHLHNNNNCPGIDMNVRNYFKKDLIPKSVDYCMLSVHMATSYVSNKRTREAFDYRDSIFDGVIIPKIPSVRNIIFEWNPKINPQFDETLDETITNSLVRPHEETKCLLIFSSSKHDIHLTSLLDSLIQHSSSVAIGGGIIKAVKTVQQHKSKINPIRQGWDHRDRRIAVSLGLQRRSEESNPPRAVCIAFVKDKSSELDNFNAYSVTIKNPNLSRDEFTLKLIHFRSNIVLKCHSLAFRVSKFNGLMELETFEEVFPDVPLASIEAPGEFGSNSYPNPIIEPGNDIRQEIQFSHAVHNCSSIFVIITWD